MDTMETPARLLAKRLWRGLGPGRTWTIPARAQGVASADSFLAAIDDLIQAPVRGDSTRIHLLIAQGFLTAERSEDGRTLTYHLATEEPPVDFRTWQEREQAEINRQVALNERLLDEDYQARRRAQEVLMEPQRAEERAKVLMALQHPDVQAAIRRIVRSEVEAALQPAASE